MKSMKGCYRLKIQEDNSWKAVIFQKIRLAHMKKMWAQLQRYIITKDKRKTCRKGSKNASTKFYFQRKTTQEKLFKLLKKKKKKVLFKILAHFDLINVTEFVKTGHKTG